MNTLEACFDAQDKPAFEAAVKVIADYFEIGDMQDDLSLMFLLEFAGIGRQDEAVA